MQILVKLLNQNHEAVTDTIQIPLGSTIQNLRLLAPQFTRFYIDNVQISDGIQDILSDLGKNLEEVITISCEDLLPVSSMALSCKASYSGHEGAVICVKICPLGKYVCSGGGDNTVRFWDETYTQTKVIKNHTSWITCIDYKNFIAVGAMDGIVSVYDSAWNCTNRLFGHKSAISGICIADNGDIITSSRDGSVIFWINHQLAFSYSHGDVVDHVFYDKSDNTITSCGRDRSVKTYSLDKYIVSTIEHAHSSRINCVYKCQDLMVSGSDDFSVNIYINFVKIHSYSHSGCVSSVCVDLNNKYLASGSLDKTVFVLNLKTKKVVAKYMHADAVLKVMIDNNLLFSCSKDGTIVTFDLNTMKRLNHFSLPMSVYDIDYRNGLLVAACQDKKVYFFK